MGIYINNVKNRGERIGLWEDGKRIEWFGKKMISDIMNGQKDYRYFFKKEENQVSDQYFLLERPEGFDEKLKYIYKYFGTTAN